MDRSGQCEPGILFHLREEGATKPPTLAERRISQATRPPPQEVVKPMCMIMPPVTSDHSVSIAAFLASKPQAGLIAVRFNEALPCGCAPTKAARKSGRRGVTVHTDGRVTHTRCGNIVGVVRRDNSGMRTSSVPQERWVDTGYTE